MEFSDYSSYSSGSSGTSALSIILYVLQIVAYWKIFTKAGVEGWKSIIPIYSAVVYCKIVGVNPWLLLGLIIPIVNIFIAIYLLIVWAINGAKSFGQSTAFAIGLFFLPQIFQIILGFGSAEYVGPAGIGGTGSGTTEI